jgi:hypothetical protein
MKHPTRSPKSTGEWAEVCFLARVLALGYRISKPYGDNAPYDFIVDSGSRLSRVQVKSVAAEQQNCFHITLGHGLNKRGYASSELDLMAAYVIPCDAWYLIPLAAIGRIRALWFSPHRPSRRKFELYREAWHLLE